MVAARKKKTTNPVLQKRQAALEQQAAAQGMHVHYDLLEAAGLRLKDGICKIQGEYHIFIDRRKSDAQRIERLEDLLGQPPPSDVPEHDGEPTPGEETPA